MTDNEKFEMGCGLFVVTFCVMIIGLPMLFSLLYHVVGLMGRETLDRLLDGVVALFVGFWVVYWVILVLMEALGFIRRMFEK